MTERQKYVWLPLLTGLIATVIGGAISNGLFQLWPNFWVCIGFTLYLTVPLILGLYVHNLFYHATFLWIKYHYQIATGDQDQALKTLVSFITARPFDSYPWLQQASIYLRRKDFQHAEESINVAIRLDGEKPELLDVKISVLWASGNWQELVGTIERAIQLDPRRTDLHYDLSAVNLYLGRYRLGTSSLINLIEKLIEKAKSLETENRLTSSRRELWTVTEVQQKTIEVFEGTLLDFHVSTEEKLSLKVFNKLNALAISTKHLTYLGAEVVDLCFQKAELDVALGKHEMGIDLLKELAKALVKEAKKLERESSYAGSRERLWAIVKVQGKEINILKETLFKFRDEQRKLRVKVNISDQGRK